MCAVAVSCSLVVVCWPLRVFRCSLLLVVCCLLAVVRYVLFVVRCCELSVCVARCSLFLACRLFGVRCCLVFVVAVHVLFGVRCCVLLSAVRCLLLLVVLCRCMLRFVVSDVVWCLLCGVVCNLVFVVCFC